MPERRLIGDILSERRRNLGLSLDRVVNDTKLQRRMVEAFEDSDFDAMPPKGYAQASLASYARYLGLDTNEILRIYDDQLYDFQREAGLGSHPSRRRSAANPSDADDYRPPARGRRAAPREERRRYGVDHREERPEDQYDRFETPRRHDGYRHDTDYGRIRTGEHRSSERGLYDSGYGREDRRSTARSASRYESERPYDRESRDYESPQRRTPVDRSRPVRPRSEDDGRRGYRGGRGTDYTEPRSRRSDTRDRGRSRGETQVVSLDDGYQGGSGGPDADLQGRYRPRGSVSTGQRVSLAEVVRGFVRSIVADRRTFTIIACTVALSLIIVLIVGISSCVRSAPKGEEGETNIPVTPVTQDEAATGDAQSAQTVPAAPSIDLSALPANSVLTITVGAEVTALPWVEVYVDGGGVYASTPNPGDVIQFTVTSSAEVRIAFSDATATLDGITVAVNDVAVTPTLDNGTYVLSMSVAADQLPQDSTATAAEGEQPTV